MRKFYLFLTALAISISAFAAEFSVGGAKYTVLPDGTVELKEFKKASGDVVIPEKVADPKGGAEYTVTSIGKAAFKKAPMTTVTIPATVKTLGAQAFVDCKNLTTANLPQDIVNIPDECFKGCKALTTVNGADTMKTIGSFAFSDTALTGILIPATTERIGFRAFSPCPDLKTVQIEAAPLPLKIEPGIFYGSPVEQALIFRNLDYLQSGHFLDKFRLYNNNPALVYIVIGKDVNTKDWKDVLVDCANAAIFFEDENAGSQALNVFQSLYGKEAMSLAKIYFTSKDIDLRFRVVGDSRSLSEVFDRNDHSYSPLNLPTNGIFFGLDSKEAVRKAHAIAKGYYNMELQNFLAKMQEFTRVAVEEPQNMRNVYRSITPEESVKFRDYERNVIRVLCDEIYLVKPELSEAELNVLEGFISNYLMFIGADYGVANLNLEQWAKYDLLNKDLESGEHKDDYERILTGIDRLLDHAPKEDIPYYLAMQLAALCALERWEEAAKYYPIVCRYVTDNGKYYQLELPYELTYMQKAINAHGYKAVTPTYKKATAKSKSSDNGSAIQFFMQKAIEMGVDHYKKKKAEKEFRELYYESMGLDKKGRPKKK